MTWRDAKGFALGDGVVANHFTVAGGRVATLVRYDDLDAALRAAGLGADDEAEAGDA